MPRRTLLVFLAMLPVVFSSGCRKKTSSALKIHPVSGVVFFEGNPAEGAAVRLHPVDDPNSRMFVGTVGADGSFQITTQIANDGAPEGKYIITLIYPKTTMMDDVVKEEDLFNGRFSEPSRSIFSVEVNGPTTIPKFNLQ